eukprot:TRINITY_DN15847_c0_g1_i1.p1 TRINITY_DN15847_c0_g1~~TRINITY_DN15847_c0_g1_i1.p1  ORF type:complete len:130 (-),score=21.13 TRINITY_DN15847_c0_g1_i1:434-787(-)
MAALQMASSSTAFVAPLALNLAASSKASAAASVSVSQSANYPSVVCGRGDKRTAKGKRFRGSFGNSRPKDPRRGRGLAPTPLPARRAPKKEDFPEGEYIHVDIDESLYSAAPFTVKE